MPTRPRATRKTRTAPQRLEQLQQLRALTHPLRLQLLELFACEPLTTKQAAERLGEPPTRLYHHVYAMERAGLLRLQSTRPVRGAVERYYEAVARRFTFDPKMFARAPVTSGGTPARAAALGLADALRADLQGMTGADRDTRPIEPIIVRAILHVDAARLRAIRARLAGMLTRLGKPRTRARTSGTPTRYALTLALLPAPDLAASRRRRRLRG